MIARAKKIPTNPETVGSNGETIPRRGNSVIEAILRVLENLYWRSVKPMVFILLDDLIERFDEEIITSGSQAADIVREIREALEGFEDFKD